jgi:putative FmdB family regulatory protein
VPTYQYSCTECGHFFEAVQSFSDDSLTVCPECEGRLRKVFNAVGVVFKGSGFYRTDSRSSTNGSGSKNGSEGGSSTPEKAASSTGSTSADSGSSNGAKKAVEKSSSAS